MRTPSVIKRVLAVPLIARLIAAYQRADGRADEALNQHTEREAEARGAGIGGVLLLEGQHRDAEATESAAYRHVLSEKGTRDHHASLGTRLRPKGALAMSIHLHFGSFFPAGAP